MLHWCLEVPPETERVWGGLCKLEDLYKEFSKQKKHYATRLRHAFIEHHIETINDLMSLSLNDLLNMDGIGSETLRLLVKKLNSLGFDYYPVVKPK